MHEEPSPSRNPKADFGANNVAILNIQQYDERPRNAQPGATLTTFFRVEFDQLNAALTQRGLYGLKSGEPVYLSALTQFIQPNQEQPSGPIYDNYDELVRDANMPHIDFTQYYNICVIYHSPEVPVKKRAYIDGDILVSEEDQGQYKPGQPVQVRFDETITYNGQTYEIYKSWLSPISNESLVTWLQDLSDNDPTNDKVAVRDFTTFVSGTIVKGYYRLKQQDDDCTTNPYLPECGGSDPGGPDPGRRQFRFLYMDHKSHQRRHATNGFGHESERHRTDRCGRAVQRRAGHSDFRNHKRGVSICLCLPLDFRSVGTYRNLLRQFGAQEKCLSVCREACRKKGGYSV